MINLKRCLLVSRVEIEGTDKQLVLVNLHLEAYDDGEGKIAQTKMLAEFLNTEAEKGNYVIAGGDFNQIFSTADTSAYPAQEGKWAAGEIDVTQIDGEWQFLMDSSVPSCRSLDQAYENADKDTFQYYLIDGFIVSDNITVESCENQNLGFKVSDHNPVVLKITLDEVK
jgi:endonuclease/exonuclease/phosphatase family metal-dependent hydrolase